MGPHAFPQSPTFQRSIIAPAFQVPAKVGRSAAELDRANSQIIAKAAANRENERNRESAERVTWERRA
jgi:hypothetical protein